MQQVSTQKIMFGAVMVLLVSMMALTGCSNAPMNPDSDNNGPEPRVLSRSGLAVSGADMAPVNLYIESVISARDGGTLSLLDVILTIHSGAVPNDTLFSIFIPDDEMFYNEFGTSGLVFDHPVTVTMSYRDANLSGVDESSIRIGWLNEETGAWVDMECKVDFDSKTVTGELQHFSAYALVSD